MLWTLPCQEDFTAVRKVLTTTYLAPTFAAVTYGQRFKLVRKSRFKGTVLDLAQRLKGPKAAPQIVHNIDKLQRVPALKTIARHAKAVGCEPWELLLQVETEFDFARRINALPENQRDECWTMLVSKGPWNLSLVSGQLAQEHDPIPVPTPEGQSDKLALEVNPRSRVQGILSRIVFGKGNENVEVEGDLPDDPAGREQHALRWLDAAAFAGQRAATILRGLPPRTAAPREADERSEHSERDRSRKRRSDRSPRK
jgi:hypothetical protein